MPANDKRGRYTLRFNPADPQQEKVIRLLDEQGRHKAAFITSAVLSYVQGDGIVPHIGLVLGDKQMRKVVLDILSMQNKDEWNPYNQNKSELPSIEENYSRRFSGESVTEKKMMTDNAEITGDMCSAITEALKGFRS